MAIHNYVFDLYETLIDIRTDEGAPSFWKGMAQLYSRSGACYLPEDLHHAYLRMVNEEETALCEKTGLTYPEIVLDNVFLRLLQEAPDTIPSAISRASASTVKDGVRTLEDIPVTDSSMELRRKCAQDPSWLYMIANAFRSLSMRRFRLYPGTLKTLKALRQRGDQVFLLSNAQAVFTRPELEMTGLLPVFNGTYISSEKGMKKPQPEFMQALLDEYHLDPAETMMVGNDTWSDVAVALPCGVTGCLLNTYHLDDDEISRRFEKLRSQFPGSRTAVIRSGKISELLSPKYSDL